MKNSSSSNLAVKKSAPPKKKKSSAKAMSPARKRKPDVDVQYVPNPNNVDDGRRITRHEFHMRVMKFQKKKAKAKVKQEPKSKLPKVIEGETLCPVCGMKNYSEGGYKTITCTWPHPNKQYVYYCGLCGMLSEKGLLPKCKCSYSFDRWAREQPVEVNEDDASEEEEENTKISFLERLEYCQFINDDDEDNTSRASTDSSSASEKMGGGRDSDANDSFTSTKTTSEAVAMASARDEDDDVQDEVPTAVLSDRTIKIKQDPDAVPSTAFEEETVCDKIPPQEDISSTAIPVVLKVKTEGANNGADFHEATDVEDSASSKEDGGEEEEDDDVAALIYQESQHRKREAAEAAAAEEEGRKAARKKCRKGKETSTRKGGTAPKKSSNYEEESAPSPSAKAVIDLSDVPPQLPILRSEGDIKVGSSKYAGVSFHKASNKWRANIVIKGKHRHIGLYEKEEEAAIDYARAVIKYKDRGADEDEEAPTTAGPKKSHKQECSADGCTNNAVKGGVCKRHGGKTLCSSEGCTNLARKGGVCKRHGGVIRCKWEGCTNQRVKGGLCKRHGAERKQCSSEGCTNLAVTGGLCKTHGTKDKPCSIEGCPKKAQKGGVCIRHGAEVTRKTCSIEGCTNQVQRRGVCIRHGAGVYMRHGANRS